MPGVLTLLVLVLLLGSPKGLAVEVLSIHELASHCERLEAEPMSADGQYCVRYIQGFIDGAVATDARVMMNVEGAQETEETFSDRAKRTRVPNNADRFRAARLAGFCLGDPLPLRNVVGAIVADLAKLDHGTAADTPAREAVYKSLMEHYPCPA
ncbi:hypothetical protein EYC98_09720 [Halieaceae bacterium IMCC14734]|uniref:Rap1a immunity protein domain-containing protein n=2 Tax=Candidatus Litorirhabdus singularis TaxID=2518993 RepID=A0ABT3TFS5_9GAMM|nr:hypothetical protein [Candidatus Litorirhabdus singularis]